MLINKFSFAPAVVCGERSKERWMMMMNGWKFQAINKSEV